MPDVVVAGHLCLDIIAALGEVAASRSTLLSAGSLTMLEHGAITTGGVVANTGLAFHRLGVDVGLMARLGDDAIGYMTGQLVAQHGDHLTEGLHVVSGETSGYTIVVNAPGRERSFLVYGAANDRFGPQDLDRDTLARTRIVHFGYPPLLKRMFTAGDNCLVDVLSLAHHAGATTSLDLAMPDPASASGQADWPGILARALPLADIFCPSIEELLFMLRRQRFDSLVHDVGTEGLLDAMSWQEIQELAHHALDMGAKVVLIKLGHRGGYLLTGDSLGVHGRGAPANHGVWQHRELWAPCFSVEVANAVGAGDAAVAGFLTAILKGYGPENALLAAMAVGACNVEKAGGAQGVMRWDETLGRIAGGWAQRHDVVPDAGAWRQTLSPNGHVVWDAMNRSQDQS